MSSSGFLPPRLGGTLTVPLPDRPVTLDPARASRESEFQIIKLVHDTLFVLDQRGQPRPHLVLPEIEAGADKRSWTLTLRPGIRLHNGAVLTAAQVAASLNRLRKGPNGYLLGAVRSVSASDGSKLLFSLKKKTNRLPWILCSPATSVVVRRGGKLLGSGPFLIQSVKVDRWQLRAHAAHFAGRPLVDRLTLSVWAKGQDQAAAYQVGAAQLSFHGAAVFGGTPKHPVRRITAPRRLSVYLASGRDNAMLADGKVRGALLAAIDRGRLVKLLGAARAEVAVGPISSSILRRPGKAVRFNRAAARRQLERAAARHSALAPLRDSGGRVTVGLLVDRSRPEDRILAGQIVADLDRVGVAVKMQAVDAALYRKTWASGRFELALVRQVVTVPRASVAVAGAHALAGESSLASACLARTSCGRRQARAFARRLPLIPLLHLARTADHDARLGGVRFDAAGLLPYADIHWKRSAR